MPLSVSVDVSYELNPNLYHREMTKTLCILYIASFIS